MRLFSNTTKDYEDNIEIELLAAEVLCLVVKSIIHTIHTED